MILRPRQWGIGFPGLEVCRGRRMGPAAEDSRAAGGARWPAAHTNILAASAILRGRGSIAAD
jgi:hypothetical protein